MPHPDITSPEVSVVIPAYNAMAYLPETLDSVWAQTFKNFEVIVVDDGSSDHICEWANTQSDPRFRLTSQSNQGLAGARNTGIRLSRGEYVAFLDADDIWAPTKLALQMEALRRVPEAALAYTWSALTDSRGIPTGNVFDSRATGNIWPELILYNFVGCGSTPIVKRSCFEVHGEFDRNLGSAVEDWDMWLRLALHHPFVVVPKPLTYYRQHEGSASRNWQQMERSFNIVLDKAFKSAESLQIENLEALRRRAYANVYLNLAWKPLQCADKDTVAALQLKKQAAKYDSAITRTREYWRLTLAIALMQQFGEAGYKRILGAIYRLRRMTAPSS